MYIIAFFGIIYGGFPNLSSGAMAMANERAEGDKNLSTKEFLKHYLQYYKEGKTQEDLIVFLEKEYKKTDLKKTFQNYFDRAVLYVIESTNQEILPKLNRNLSPELDGLLKRIK